MTATTTGAAISAISLGAGVQSTTLLLDSLDEDYARDYEPGYALGSAVRAHMLKG